MRWWVGFFCLAVIAAALCGGTAAQALTLKVAPLEYRAELSKGEKKKGFIDITNPSATATKVTLSVMGFRQVDDNGAVEFYADEHLAAGVLLDYTEVEIGAHETLHLAFLVDSTKLPEGNVYGAIFASTVAPDGVAAGPAVRVGTLLSLVNGTQGENKAEVAALQLPWLQVGEAITAQIAVKNTAAPERATGFYPDITVALQPYSNKTVSGPLVFAGRTRTVAYGAPGNYFGPMLVSATVGKSTKTQLVFAITGYWRWLMPVFLALGFALAFAVRQFIRATKVK